MYFWFYCLRFWCHIKKITLPKPFSRIIFSKLYSSSFLLSCLKLKSLIHLKLTFVSGKDKGPVSFFCMWISHFHNTIYWRDYPSPFKHSWLPCQILVDNICMGLLLGSEFCCIGLCVCFYASTVLYWYLSFVIWFEIRNFNVFSIFHSSWDFFGYLGSFVIPCGF